MRNQVQIVWMAFENLVTRPGFGWLLIILGLMVETAIVAKPDAADTDAMFVGLGCIFAGTVSLLAGNAKKERLDRKINLRRLRLCRRLTLSLSLTCFLGLIVACLGRHPSRVIWALLATAVIGFWIAESLEPVIRQETWQLLLRRLQNSFKKEKR